jgi:hypothetical protein
MNKIEDQTKMLLNKENTVNHPSRVKQDEVNSGEGVTEEMTFTLVIVG